MKDSQKTQQFKLKDINMPHENDILLGRGGASIHNDANVRYRAMVREHKKAYQTYTRLQKTKLAESLVSAWQTQNPPGRFLEKDDKTSLWSSIGVKSARRKTSQLLREGAPKIRRQLKDESDYNKRSTKAATLPPAVKLSQRSPRNRTRTVTPGAHANNSVTENKFATPFHSNNNSSSSSSSNATTTPLKQITPAEANRTAPPQPPPYPYYHYSGPNHWPGYAAYPSPVSVATTKPIFSFSTPPPTAPTKRELSDSSFAEPVKYVTPDINDVRPSSTFQSFAPSPEPALGFELSNFQASWDFDGDILDNCGDISTLVGEIDKDDEIDIAASGPAKHMVHSNKFSLPDSTIDVRPSPPRARLLRQTSPPRSSSLTGPSSIMANDDDEQPIHFLDTFASFSFSSMDSAGQNNKSVKCFDTMDCIVSPESTGGEGGGALSSAVDILDELDKELEAEFLLPM